MTKYLPAINICNYDRNLHDLTSHLVYLTASINNWLRTELSPSDHGVVSNMNVCVALVDMLSKWNGKYSREDVNAPKFISRIVNVMNNDDNCRTSRHQCITVKADIYISNKVQWFTFDLLCGMAGWFASMALPSTFLIGRFRYSVAWVSQMFLMAWKTVENAATAELNMDRISHVPSTVYYFTYVDE